MKAKGVLLLLLFVANGLWACDCKNKSTVKNEIKNASTVFIGKFVSREPVTLIDTLEHNGYQTTTISESFFKNTFELSALYKGKIHTEQIIVISGIGTEDCGFLFEKGKDYVIYAKYPHIAWKGYHKFLRTNSCTRTTEYSQEEITEIGKYLKSKRIKKNKS